MNYVSVICYKNYIIIFSEISEKIVYIDIYKQNAINKENLKKKELLEIYYGKKNLIQYKDWNIKLRKSPRK